MSLSVLIPRLKIPLFYRTLVRSGKWDHLPGGGGETTEKEGKGGDEDEDKNDETDFLPDVRRSTN